MATTTGRLPDTESTGSPLVRLMRNPNYVALWLSNALNFGGEQLRLAAQAWWILEGMV